MNSRDLESYDLFVAVKDFLNGYCAISYIQTLLEQGASQNYCDPSNGDTCLHLAVRHDRDVLISLLLYHGGDITRVNHAGRTPIQLADCLGLKNSVKAIAINKSTDAEDKAGYNDILISAAYSRDKGMVACLLEAGARPCKNLMSDLAYNEYWNVVMLIARHVRTDKEDTANYAKALFKAVEANELEVANVLLKAGAPTTFTTLLGSGLGAEDENCLHRAAKQINLPMMILLFSFGISISDKDYSGNLASFYAPQLFRFSCETSAKAKQVRNEFSAVIQSRRQAKSYFNRMSPDCLNLIIRFLSLRPVNAVTSYPSVKSTRDFMTKVSAECLLKSSVGMFKFHSQQSEDFLKEVKKIVETEAVTTEKINLAVKKFMDTNPDLNSRTVKLLTEYKFIQKEEKKNENGYKIRQ
ncbi:MAG TPA: ankyrin repeat domain-containing protein [Gammaproteobacteria bacterium]|nr:ankyrin repeat domain-containing protein [Gammaproteobacteria bacterium]